MGNVSAILERELDESATVVERVDEGLLNETYRVDYGDSTYVLQIAPDDEEAAANLRVGANCYRLLDDTDVPAPKVVPGTPGTHEGRTYVVVEALPGETGKLDVSPERTRNAGRQLAEIHRATSFDEPGWLRFDDGPSVVEFDEGGFDAWRRRKVLDNARYLRDGGMERVGRDVERLFDEGVWLSPADSRAVLCHNDFSPDNVLFSGSEVTGVIDFDHAYAAQPFRDVAKAANGFWMHDPGADWDVRETFYDGYRAVRELGEEFAAAEPRLRVETLTVGVGGMVRMDEFSAAEKEFYAERLQAAIERI